MEVKPGYKRTEAGIIPADWEAATIGDVAQFFGGSQPPKSTFKRSSSKGYIRLIQIRDYKTSEHAVYIPEFLARKRCNTDDIMIGRYGPPIFQILRGIEGAYNVALVRVEPNSRIDREFFFNILRQEKLFQLVDALSRRSSGQTGIEMPALKAFDLPLPCLPEQRAIAAALNDADSLLGGLDRLIAKKRDLKQAAMQQLLTGQTRLPGFREAWEDKRLGELAEIVSGGTPKTSEPAYWSGGIKWCTPTDITGCPGKYLIDTERSISQLGLNSSGARLLPAGALLLCSRATIGELKIASGQVCTNQGLKSLICYRGLSNEFLYYKLSTMKAQMVERAFGSTFLEISKASVAALEIPTPPLVEQSAIATVLSDMDAELSALEARRAKTRALKQAMMQALLTGRIRLV